MYILKSQTTGKYYIGSTNNINRRLNEHKKNYTRTTRVLNAKKLVYKEKFDNIQSARQREKQLKSYKSHKYIDWLINKVP